MLYICNINRIEGLCSLIHEGEPSAMDYIRWLSVKVTGLPKMFPNINGNLISAAIESSLMITGNSIDLAALHAVVADSGADILPMGWDVRKAVQAASKKWWHSFGYDYMLVTIQTKFREVIAHVQPV
jgi:hypothetical protein